MSGFSAQELTKILHHEIPITQALGVNIQSLTGTEIELVAPLENNINIHGTAFAGSLYAVMSIAGWSLVANMVKVQLGRLHTVVLKEGNIKYKRPLADNLIAISSLADEDVDSFVSNFQQHNKAQIDVSVVIQTNGKHAAEFLGTYVVKAK